MSDDQAPPTTITTYDVGVLIGYRGDRDTVMTRARSWLLRKGIAATGREPGRDGQNLYPLDKVTAAIEQAPGKGSPGQPRPNRRKSKAEDHENKHHHCHGDTNDVHR